MNVSIVVPIYNEEEAVKETLLNLAKEFENFEKEGLINSYEIIAVNDGSTDRTKDILSKLKLKRLKLIEHKRNLGYGASLKTGISNSKYEWIFIIDADGTYPIEETKKLLEHCNSYDMVIGARIKRGAKIPSLRRIPKWFLNKYASFLTNYEIPDLNSGMRFFKKDLSLKYWNLYPDGFSFTSVLTMASILDKHEILYVPINYYKRKGKSSIHPIKDTIRFFTLISKLTLYFNPIKPFSLAAFFIFLLGFSKAFLDFSANNSIGNFSLFMFILAIQLFFFGIVLDIIVKSLRNA